MVLRAYPQGTFLFQFLSVVSKLSTMILRSGPRGQSSTASTKMKKLIHFFSDSLEQLRNSTHPQLRKVDPWG